VSSVKLRGWKGFVRTVGRVLRQKSRGFQDARVLVILATSRQHASRRQPVCPHARTVAGLPKSARFWWLRQNRHAAWTDLESSTPAEQQDRRAKSRSPACRARATGFRGLLLVPDWTVCIASGPCGGRRTLVVALRRFAWPLPQVHNFPKRKIEPCALGTLLSRSVWSHI
jgi:hypothetical protein